MDSGRVGNDGYWPRRALLLAYDERPEGALSGTGKLGTADEGCAPHFAVCVSLMGWPRKLINMFRGNGLNDEIQRELSFHIQERIDQLIASGLTAEEARSKARRQFGNYDLVR